MLYYCIIVSTFGHGSSIVIPILGVSVCVNDQLRTHAYFPLLIS